MNIFEKAFADEMNISKVDIEKVASEQSKDAVSEFKKKMEDKIVQVKVAQITNGNKDMERVIDIVLGNEKTASTDKKEYVLDLKKYASAILQRTDAANQGNKRMEYTDGAAKLIKIAYSSMWDEEVVERVPAIKLATQMLINDISFLRGRDDLRYDFIPEAPVKEKVASDMK